MSKRSDFERVPKDFYATVDPKAIPERFVQEVRGKTYCEPCYGEGDLEDLLMDVATCKWRSDIRATVGSSKVMDALDLDWCDIADCDLIITNPPYKKDLLLPLIDHFASLKPTWLLLPADMMHNKYFAPYMETCSKAVSIGRLCWFPKEGKRVASTDNFCWYLFGNKTTKTTFYGRKS